jgi:hypothetical protein
VCICDDVCGIVADKTKQREIKKKNSGTYGAVLRKPSQGDFKNVDQDKKNVWTRTDSV